MYVQSGRTLQEAGGEGTKKKEGSLGTEAVKARVILEDNSVDIEDIFNKVTCSY